MCGWCLGEPSLTLVLRLTRRALPKADAILRDLNMSELEVLREFTACDRTLLKAVQLLHQHST